jgi:glycosyltransferase involved in cell wall biosynthesis
MRSDSVEVKQREDRLLGNEGALNVGHLDRPLSVLHIGKFYPPHRGGVETYLRHLVCEQVGQMAVEVVVANDRALTETGSVDGARVTRVACFGTIASQPICPSLPWKLIGRDDSIVHLHVPNPWAAQAYLMSGHTGRLIISHHADTLGRRHLRKLVDPFVRRVMQRADAIIVASKRYLDTSEELVEFRAKCHLIPYGIETGRYKRELLTEVHQIRETYGPRLIVAVGRLVSYKGFEYLLRAMQSVDATLLLIGDGPARKELEAARQQLGVTQKVQLLGAIEDPTPYYKAAMMLVLPSVSRAESFGMVQVEAMAAGIPVVNTQIDSGVPEVSVDGVTGITIPPRDPDSLATAMRTLLDCPEMRIRYGQAALARAHKEYTARRMAEDTLAVYESVLASSNKVC